MADADLAVRMPPTRVDRDSGTRDPHRASRTSPAAAPMASEPHPARAAYTEVTRQVERLHRRFLDVLRTRLQALGVVDVNAVQVLLLCNIGEAEISARQLMDRGYYQGSNASYNIKRLVETGYLEQRQAPHDRRSTLLRVSDKGRDLCAAIAAAEAEFSDRFQADELSAVNRTLRALEQSWDGVITVAS